MRKRFAAVVLGGFLLVPSVGNSQIGGGGVVICANCSSEVTAIAMKATQIMQYIEEASIALSTLQTAQQLIREGKNLVTHPSTNIAANLQTLQNILLQTQGLAGNLAQIDQTFQNIYAPYAPNPVVTWAAAYQKWAQTTWNTIHGTADAIGLQNILMQTDEAQFFAQVQTMNQTAYGQDELIQLGNAIGTEEVSQLQKLRLLMMADMSGKAAFMAQQNVTQQAEQANVQNVFTHAQWVGDPTSW